MEDTIGDVPEILAGMGVPEEGRRIAVNRRSGSGPRDGIQARREQGVIQLLLKGVRTRDAGLADTSCRNGGTGASGHDALPADQPGPV